MYRYRGDTLTLQSVSNVSSCTDPTFGPCSKVTLSWAKNTGGGGVVMTTSIIALQSNESAGIIFEFALPAGLTNCNARDGSPREIATAWPVCLKSGNSFLPALPEICSRTH